LTKQLVKYRRTLAQQRYNKGENDGWIIEVEASHKPKDISEPPFQYLQSG